MNPTLGLIPFLVSRSGMEERNAIPKGENAPYSNLNWIWDEATPTSSNVALFLFFYSKIASNSKRNEQTTRTTSAESNPLLKLLFATA